MRRRHKTARPGEPWRFEQPKVLVKDTTTDFACTYEEEHYYDKDVLLIVPQKDAPSPIDLRFVAGIINSGALRFYYRTTFKLKKRGSVTASARPSQAACHSSASRSSMERARETEYESRLSDESNIKRGQRATEELMR